MRGFGVENNDQDPCVPMNENELTPITLVFAGSDPTGGAGIQADIEAIASVGSHAAPVITAITAQDTCDVRRVYPMDPEMVADQARAVLQDMPVAAIKIGMLGSVEIADTVASILQDYPQVPVVLDPVLASGSGTALAETGLPDYLRRYLFPLVSVATPNSLEARRLANEADNLDACAQVLLETGCEYLLITGSHEQTPKVTNRLYGNRRLLDSYAWDRLPHTYHGSGCTLASALAGLLAHGMEIFTAVYEAQHYTWQCLAAAQRLGMGQHLPDRFFWADESALAGTDEA